MQNNQSIHCHQPSYSCWSLIVALILALILLWMLLTGRGPSSACCGAPVEAAAPVEEATPAAAPIAEAFGFTATANDFTSNGDGTKLSWISQTDGLKALLAGGDDLQAQGDDKSVVIRGTVDTEAIKQQKGTDAQAFFGPSVAVDNQILVKAAESVTAMEPPPAAKLYFDTGKTGLPSDSGTTLAPIVEWLKAHDTAKAVLSGYHDPRGNQAVNEQLAKNRAKSVREALKAAGIDEARIEMRKPEGIDGGADLAEARRVEVSVD